MKSTTTYKIRKRRNELDYSQEYMASKLGISQPAYPKIESGETNISLNRIQRIADILEVDLAYLLDNNTIVNNFHNNAENMKGVGIVENLYQDNKEYSDKIITQLENDKKWLQGENEKLHRIIRELNNEKS